MPKTGTSKPRASGKPRGSKPSIDDLLAIMARLRSPTGCPWDREQSHETIRYHAVEEVYELIDAIENHDDHEMEEELGDLLLQVVFHCQLAKERGVFDFESVARRISDKLIHRHPHVFGKTKVDSVDAVWAQWEKIKRAEKAGTRHERASALDGIPKHLPALMSAQKLAKKARKAGLLTGGTAAATKPVAPRTKAELGRVLFDLAQLAQEKGWQAEESLRAETRKRTRAWRRAESRSPAGGGGQ